MKRRAHIRIASAAAVLSLSMTLVPVAAENPAEDRGLVARAISALGLVLQSFGNLAGGESPGAVWRFDRRTGVRSRIGLSADLAWPVSSADGIAIYALRGRQVLRITVADGRETPIGAPADWYKLLGALPDGSLLGFINDDPLPRPAVLGTDGSLRRSAPAQDDEERRRDGLLLQEMREYSDGTRLEVRRSERGGRGRDVFLLGRGPPVNLSDCADDICGQPSRSIDGTSFVYVRARSSHD